MQFFPISNAINIHRRTLECTNRKKRRKFKILTANSVGAKRSFWLNMPWEGQAEHMKYFICDEVFEQLLSTTLLDHNGSLVCIPMYANDFLKEIRAGIIMSLSLECAIVFSLWSGSPKKGDAAKAQGRDAHGDTHGSCKLHPPRMLQERWGEN